ncbi:extracellular solute-binding protein [Paenibacillus sp.]|uniref:extracellular solute-binding protein n=1 Tax=Paenibacillus sp. TaxID=58172 RepID=UPI002D4D678F|nr:extracellular solute-binding protein [Paenibacillus sp.]HZG87870.1 extracellular solute-binding protein [Paenibacillus sp.]
MKKSDIRYASLPLALTMVLSACSSGAGSNSGTTDAPSAPAKTSETTAPAAAESEGSEFLVSEKPVELSWFVQNDSKVTATMKDFSEMKIMPILKEATNVTINFKQPPVGMESEQFNLMISSGDLTDMIYWNWSAYPGGPEKALRDGVIIPLNDLVDKHAPNFKRFLEENPHIQRDIMTDDGTLYTFPITRDGDWPKFVFGFQLRQDWLDRLNLEVPKTMDDWYNVLTAFKNSDPNVIPFGNQTPSKIGDMPLLHFMSAWGMAYGFYQVDGSVKFGAAQPEYKEFLATMKKWYDEGLIDPDFSATDGKQFDAKVTGHRLGSFGAMLNGGMGRLSDLMKDDPNFKLVGAPFPTAKDGKSYNFHYDARSPFPGFGNAVSSKSKKAVEAVKWMDVAYSEWGHNLMNFGIEGETYNWVDGYPKYTDLVLKNDSMPAVNVLAQYTMASVNGRFFQQDSRYFEQILTYPQQKEASMTWSQASIERQMPIITPTSDESSRLASTMSEINTYADEMLLKFITGRESLDNFDAYVERLYQMNLEEAISIQQAALERYKQR